MKRRKLKVTKHHIQNRCEGGSSEEWNILHIYRYKHDVFHLLFKNKNLDQCIALLMRVKRLKERQHEKRI
jgi:hypothetical protein